MLELSESVLVALLRVSTRCSYIFFSDESPTVLEILELITLPSMGIFFLSRCSCSTLDWSLLDRVCCSESSFLNNRELPKFSSEKTEMCHECKMKPRNGAN